MIGDLLAILGLSFGCWLFWQQRRQSELAKSAICKKCKQLDLQLLSVSFASHRMKISDGKLKWHTTYHFEFSALGDDSYQAHLIMQGCKPTRYHIPPYRMRETLQ